MSWLPEITVTYLVVGANDEGGPGVSLYFKGIYLFVAVSTGKQLWKLEVPGPINNNTWKEIGIRWSKDNGLDLPDPVDPAVTREYPVELTVGCQNKGEEEYSHFAYGEFDELTIWMRALNDNVTKQYFLGGHACDVETHPLRCETNMKKIMDNM
ncbi:putative G-protein coupled receptor 112, partial [Caerostris extrusa]